jgi:hypothetical protein
MRGKRPRRQDLTLQATGTAVCWPCRPFVVKQQDIPFCYDLDTLIDVHMSFNEIIDRYGLPVFSGVFSLA